ncbi:MAG: hypothetical protein HUK28_01010, partial [Methanobrevibacter sp.]|nr:hypothetical protein [Methanobrevibacter sp.]
MIALVCLLSVSATLAADTNNTNEAIAIADSGTFQDLQDKISGASRILELDKNYTNTDNYSQAGIVINEDITIDGKGHTIDPQGKSRVFKIDFGVSVTLKNIIFINGNSTSNDDGGAIYSEGVLNVENCLFKNTISKYNGGAIYGYGSKVTAINSTFINTKSTFGGAIYTFIKVDVTNSTFINTTSSFGGAIYNWRNKCTVTNSTFNNTTSSIAGGAIYSEGGVIVKDSNFNDNSANINGASIYTTGVLDVKDSTFNSPNANGMAIIYITSTNAEAIITNNTITSNLLAIYNDGSIIVSPTSLKFDNNVVEIGENATLTAILTDDNGNIIGSQTNVEGEVNGTNLTFVFDKKTNKFTTVYNQTTVKGKYNIAGNYSKATNCDVINGTLYVGQIAEITAPSIVKYYKNGTQFIVKVTENDSPVAGAKIAITISGITYNRTSNENGEAKLNINLAPGEYPVNVYAIGSFGELTTNSTVTVLS